MLAYILWGDRLDEFKSDVNRATDEMRNSFRGCGRNSSRHNSYSKTGNVAFDDWREVEIARLQEERQKLNEMRQEFDEHLRELRRAKDQNEFDEFMASKKSKKSGGKSVPRT